jgi:peptide/nickel transport system permease protein
LANSTLQVGYAILFKASLSFLGLGDPNQPSWGQMLYLARENYATAWWIGLFPGLAVMLLIVAVNMLGDAINRSLGISGHSGTL